MAEVITQNNKLVIVFLIYADFVRTDSKAQVNTEFLEQLDKLCEDLIKCKINAEKFCMYVVFSRVNYLEEEEKDPNDENKEDTFVPTSSTFLYEIIPDIPGKNKVQFVETKGRTVQRVDDLVNIFDLIKTREISKTELPLKIFLNTWDHGSGFGIFKARSGSANEVKQMHTWDFVSTNSTFYYVKEFLDSTKIGLKEKGIHASLSPDKEQPDFFSFRGKVFDFKKENFKDSFNRSDVQQAEIIFKDKKTFLVFQTPDKEFHEEEINIANELLTNQELAIAIREGFKQPVDILMMMNCCMMNLDAMCWFKTDVIYFIAPETCIVYAVYDYAAILEYISEESSKELNVENIAKKCLSSIKDDSGFRQPLKNDISSCAVFGFKLDVKNEENKFLLDLAVNEINLFLQNVFSKIDKRKTKEEKDEVKFLLKYSAIFCFCFDDGSGMFFIDLIHWINNMRFTQGKQIIDDAILKEPLDRLQPLLVQLKFTDHHIGNEWFFGDEGASIHNNPTGLGVYLPSKQFNESAEGKIIEDFLIPDPQAKTIPQNGFYFQCDKWVPVIKLITDKN